MTLSSRLVPTNKCMFRQEKNVELVMETGANNSRDTESLHVQNAYTFVPLSRSWLEVTEEGKDIEAADGVRPMPPSAVPTIINTPRNNHATSELLASSWLYLHFFCMNSAKTLVTYTNTPLALRCMPLTR